MRPSRTRGHATPHVLAFNRSPHHGPHTLLTRSTVGFRGVCARTSTEMHRHARRRSWCIRSCAGRSRRRGDGLLPLSENIRSCRRRRRASQSRYVGTLFTASKLGEESSGSSAFGERRDVRDAGVHAAWRQPPMDRIGTQRPPPGQRQAQSVSVECHTPCDAHAAGASEHALNHSGVCTRRRKLRRACARILRGHSGHPRRERGARLRRRDYFEGPPVRLDDF